jgi:hypothetical protein
VLTYPPGGGREIVSRKGKDNKGRVTCFGDFFIRVFHKSTFVSRGLTVFENFWRGVPPVEADPGEYSGSGRRIEPSTIFPIAKYRHDSARGSRRLEIASSDFGSGLVLNDFSISMLSFLL